MALDFVLDSGITVQSAVKAGNFLHRTNRLEKILGGIVVTKSCNFYSRPLLSFGALVALVIAGCGGGSKTNVVTISVSPSSATVIVSQSLTLTAIVSGATNTNVSSWTCQYQTTTFDSTGKSTAGTKNACTADTGNIPANSTNTTVVFTAPNKVPDATKLAGNNCVASQICTVAILITATSAADTKITSAPATLTLDSGIAVSINPATATVPTGEQEQFVATLANDLQTQGVTWLVTQGTPVNNNYPALPTCSTLSPSCGSIDTNGLYKAPSAVPTTPTLTVVAVSKADPTRFAIASITVITGGPIKFNAVSPTVVPQGASSYDIYLDAPLISSASIVTLTPKSTGAPSVLPSGQLKVLFPIPTSTTANPGSTGMRIRLSAGNLSEADTYTVSVSDPGQPVTLGSGPFTFDVIPVRPTSVASIPDSFVQNDPLGNALNLAIDGGYFGPSGSLANVLLGFSGNPLTPDIATSSSRRLNLLLQTSDVNSAGPGLYPLSVTRTKPPLPPANNPSVTNLAIFPDYSSAPPSVVASVSATGQKPSAIDIDTRLGILAVAEPGSSEVEFFSIGSGSLTSLGTVAVNTAGGTPGTPTGLSINQTNHTIAVVDFQNQGVIVFPLPGQTGDPNVTYPVRIDLAGLLPAQPDPTDPTKTLSAAQPYSIGVDGDTNNAIVAYASSANPTTAKVGFLLDLNKNAQQTCIRPNTGFTGSPCVHAQVTLNTGASPQVAMVPHAHLAFVTPGGAGVLSGVDVTKSSSSVGISTVSLTSGLVTVTTSAPHSLTPGNPTQTVLITGVPDGASGTKFNGVFTVQSVINSTSFTYALNSSVNDTATGTASSLVHFGSPNITIGLSQTTQGIAINGITNTAAIADANATGLNGPQIDLLNSLDQSVTSITFHAGCTAFSGTCANAPELIGTTFVAFQPYSNALVSYNPEQNQLSVSNPVTQTRYALISVGSGGDGVATTPINLFGGLAVDPATNQAFVAQPGSGKIQVVNLGPIKAAQITELQVPTVTGALIGGIAGAIMPQGTLACVNTVTPSACDLAGVQIFGSGFDVGTKVQLDGVTVATLGAVPNSRQLSFTIPHQFLALPHRFAVTVVNSHNVASNAADFLVIKSVDLKKACSGGNPQPSSVAIADQLPGQGFAPIAVVSNSGCNNISVIDINPSSPQFGTLQKSISVGSTPQGVAASPRFGLAVVANNADGTASVIDLISGTQKVAAVSTGTSPTGVAINEGTGAALVTNTGSNTVSELNLALLFGSSPATTLTANSIAVDTQPIAVTIDPDRGTGSRGLAVVTALELVSGSSPIGILDSIDIGNATPAKSTTAQIATVTSTPTGVVFDPTVSPALFYANSSGGNVITAFNPDSGATSTVRVGINPTSLAINPQTGGIMSVNSTSQTISLVDTISNPFKTRRTFGISGSPQFGVAVDQFTNLAVIADQANNRVLIFPVPN